MFKFIIYFLGVFFYFPLSSASLLETSYLEDFYSYQEKDWFITELIFDNTIDFEKVSVDYINQTVQVNIPGGFLKKPFVKKIKNDKVKSIYIYQFNKKILRTRIIYQKKFQAKDFSGKVNLSFSSHMLRIAIKQGANRSFTAPLLATTKGLKRTGESKFRKTTKNSQKFRKKVLSKKNPSQEFSSQKALQLKKPSKLESLNHKQSSFLSKFFGLLSFLLLGTLLLLFWKKKNVFTPPLFKNKNYSMEIIHQHYLGTKKSLSIVKIGDEFLLLGITDYNISFLKKLPSQSPLKNHTQKEQTSCEVAPHKYSELKFTEEVS